MKFNVSEGFINENGAVKFIQLFGRETAFYFLFNCYILKDYIQRKWHIRKYMMTYHYSYIKIVQAKDNQQSGDWSGYGQSLEQLTVVLQRLDELAKGDDQEAEQEPVETVE